MSGEGSTKDGVIIELAELLAHAIGQARQARVEAGSARYEAERQRKEVLRLKEDLLRYEGAARAFHRLLSEVERANIYAKGSCGLILRAAIKEARRLNIPKPAADEGVPF